MKQLILEKIIISGFPPSNKRCLWIKGNTFYFWYKGAWRSIDSEIDINNEYIDEKVSETVAKEIDSLLDEAPEELNTFPEIVDQIVTFTEDNAEVKSIALENTMAIEEIKKQLENGGTSGGSGWTDVS